jgi:hypothetical protein
MAMAFQFVENYKIDGNTRKVMRSHVMKGKNVGKVRPKFAQKETQTLYYNKRIEPKRALQIPRRQTPRCDETVAFSVPRTPGSLISSFSFPGEMQPYGFMEKLIYHCEYDMVILVRHNSNAYIQSWQSRRPVFTLLNFVFQLKARNLCGFSISSATRLVRHLYPFVGASC